MTAQPLPRRVLYAHYLVGSHTIDVATSGGHGRPIGTPAEVYVEVFDVRHGRARILNHDRLEYASDAGGEAFEFVQLVRVHDLVPSIQRRSTLEWVYWYDWEGW